MITVNKGCHLCHILKLYVVFYYEFLQLLLNLWRLLHN